MKSSVSSPVKVEDKERKRDFLEKWNLLSVTQRKKMFDLIVSLDKGEKEK